MFKTKYIDDFYFSKLNIPTIPKKKRKGFRRFRLAKTEHTDNPCVFENYYFWTRGSKTSSWPRMTSELVKFDQKNDLMLI